MIERLTGACAAKYHGGLIIDVNGVGYGVEVTDPVHAALEVDPRPVTLWIHTHVREESIRLFGFQSQEERTLFAVLLSLSGVGPKHAIAILSRYEPAMLFSAVEREDSEIFEAVSGIGAATAKKIVLELKPKLKKLAATQMFGRQTGAVALPADAAGKRLESILRRDLESALLNFGYKEKELIPVLRRIEADPPSQDLSILIRTALQELTNAQRAERPDAAEQTKALEEIF